MTYRVKFIDPDFRKPPATQVFCARCEKDIKEGKPRRYICYEFETMSAVHPDDWDSARFANPVEFAFAVVPVGMDCAKRIGLDWTKEKAE